MLKYCKYWLLAVSQRFWWLILADLAFSWLSFLKNQQSFLFRMDSSGRTVGSEAVVGGRRKRATIAEQQSTKWRVRCPLFGYETFSSAVLIWNHLISCLLLWNLLRSTNLVFLVSQLVLNTSSKLSFFFFFFCFMRDQSSCRARWGLCTCSKEISELMLFSPPRKPKQIPLFLWSAYQPFV